MSCEASSKPTVQMATVDKRTSLLAYEDSSAARPLILTYGTFDLFHFGHLRLFERLASAGYRLGVGVSTDDFNIIKGKEAVVPFRERLSIVESIRHVDFAFPEETWEQKELDIRRYGAAALAMGSDWVGKFDDLPCEVVYLERTSGISSTALREAITAIVNDSSPAAPAEVERLRRLLGDMI